MWLHAQTDSTARQGEIVSGEVIIEKNKEIVLPPADKFYQRGELKRFDTGPLNINLTAFEPELIWPPYKSDIPAKEIRDGGPISKYPNYVRIGYGNYGSPLVKAGLFKTLGAFEIQSKLSHESFASGPVNGSNSGSSQTMFDLSGTYTKKTLNITPFISFAHQGYRFFGNTDRANPGFEEGEVPKVRWSQVVVGTRLDGKVGGFSYAFTPEFNSANQSIKEGPTLNSENAFEADGLLKINIDNLFSTGLNVEGHASKYEGGNSYNRSLFMVNPWLEYKNHSFQVRAGFNLASGKSAEINQSGFYPDLKGEWFIENDWSLYATISGGVDWVDVNELLTENEFLDDSLQILNLENRLSVGGGIKGSLMPNLYLDMSLTFADLDNLPFYVPSASDSARYTITYDNSSVQRLRLVSKLTYAPSNTSLIGATLEVNSFSVSGLDRPWHQPAFIIKGFTSHNIKQKVLISGTVLALGGVRAPTAVNFGIENLKTILDLGLKADYIITERASAFIETQNILNQEYERYLGYPVRGITFKIGGQYRF